ncbi:hypothetical protein ACOME3_008527 [Neoechinorhynchus agilis]
MKSGGSICGVSSADGSGGSLANWIEDETKADSLPYQSLSSRLSEAILNSESFAEFARKAFGIMFYTGVKYMNECPLEPKIPIYLLVAGSVGFLRIFTLIWQKYHKERQKRLEQEGIDHEEIKSTSTDVTAPILNLFLLAWFLAGNYWTLRIFKPNFTPDLHEPSKWCDRMLYSMTLLYICCTSFAICILFVFICALFVCALNPSLIVQERV